MMSDKIKKILIIYASLFMLFFDIVPVFSQELPDVDLTWDCLCVKEKQEIRVTNLQVSIKVKILKEELD